MTSSFDASPVLENLKDFQRRTVDHVFARMFDPKVPARRFLVADEVGLGKTLVAKGVIARTVERLQHKQDHVTIVYVCSNAGIATQNVARLALPGQRAFSQATRLTLLPLVTAQLREHRVNFISFTPGTAFNQTGSRGRKDERRLIYQMLRDKLKDLSARGLRNAMRGTAGEHTWPDEADIVQSFDEDIARAYVAQVDSDVALAAELRAVADIFHDRRRKISPEDNSRCGRLTSALRRVLAKVCLGTLQPDLVILDEFQRFSELFDDPETSPAAELADELFNYSDDLRVLLLSATPYKMYAADADDENHYKDFLRTIAFLMSDGPGVAALQADLHQFRMGLLGAADEADLEQLSLLKSRIELALRCVMCRTERVATTAQGDAMVRERVMVPRLEAGDLVDFRWLESVAQRLGQPDAIEYWKSSPYLLNFMKEYSHKQALRDDQGRQASNVVDLIDGGGKSLLNYRQVAAFETISAGNPRLRTLMDDMDAQGLWRLLWMPPSMSYWKPQGAFAQAGSVTKHLIFSAWNVVPDALACILSYDVERRIVAQSGVDCDFATMPDKLAARLRFSGHSDGRLGGMSTLMMMFPSRALVELVDPLKLRLLPDGEVASFDQVHARAVASLALVAEPLIDRAVQHGPPDRRWYWVALARLERVHAPDSRDWCLNQWTSAREGADDEVHDIGTVFYAHMEHWLEAWDGRVAGLGRVPPDLLEVLASLALAGPSNCALRALRTRWPLTQVDAGALLSAAARIAEGLRSQFNAPRAVGLLKGQGDDDSYWQRVLQYSVDGNLQAMLDEYVHVLVESKNLGSHPPKDAADALARAMFDAMALRAAPLRPDEIDVRDGRLRISPFPRGIRTHFALRYGGKSDDDGAAARKETVQAAFNSPFWPFVLVSTSVGQEGLDFHTWCHSVIHWNLPANPVDMEQREGRVHRYKGYAVRKNVAARYGEASLRDLEDTGSDPWARSFERAVAGRSAGSSDLVPFWIFEHHGGASIERRVMLLPLSRDEARYERLRRSLALYRMVFAQPRQQDLLSCLERAIGADRAAAISARWSIHLTPPRSDSAWTQVAHLPAPVATALMAPLTLIVPITTGFDAAATSGSSMDAALADLPPEASTASTHRPDQNA